METLFKFEVYSELLIKLTANILVWIVQNMIRTIQNSKEIPMNDKHELEVKSLVTYSWIHRFMGRFNVVRCERTKNERLVKWNNNQLIET